MFEHLFTRPRAVAPRRAGLLLEERLRYVSHLAELGMRQTILQVRGEEGGIDKSASKGKPDKALQSLSVEAAPYR
jgi:hypothetical protein